ncbi:MAG: transporter substrate-binding domain-containing protein [Coriobacteriales bacterium]|jgi:polar amino acid transport system substrate-binding protein|nr:transporter substrate-binding domain-containing protein [Coriobacteriales bacterium]
METNSKMIKGKRIAAMLRVLCVAALAMAMALLVACGGGSAEKPASGTSNDSDAGQTGTTGDKAKVYTIATDTTFAPFEFQDASGTYVGIDMEILEAIAKDQGFEYKVNAVGFDAALQAVTSGQADGVIAGMSITEDRKQVFDFSAPYFDSGVVMGISASENGIKSYEDLAGKRVAVKIGTEGEAFAEGIKAQYGFETVPFKESAMMYEDVVAGNSQACFEDYPVLGYAISQNVGLKIVTEMERGSSYGFAVEKGKNSELLEKFDAGLANIKADGTYQKILDKYIKK